MLGIMKGDYDTNVAEVFHDAPVIAAEADGFDAVFFSNHVSLEKVLRPKAGLVFAGTAVSAETHQGITRLGKIKKLLGIKIVEAVIVYQSCNEGGVVRKPDDFEALFTREGCALAKVVYEMRGGGG